MVILAVSILSNSGKILFSRAYDAMPCDTLEGYVRDFMHLLTTTSQDQNLAYFEGGGDASYVYTPIDQSPYLLLIVTKRQANIIAKKDTLMLLSRLLMLLSRLVSENSSSLDEKGILDSDFELTCAFDKVINLGYTDEVDMAQVLTSLEMCSVNEESHVLETQKKVDQAKELMKQKAREIDRTKEAAWDLEKDKRQEGPDLFGFFGKTTDRDMKKMVSCKSEDTISDESLGLVPPIPVKGSSSSGLWLDSDKGEKVAKYLEGIKAEGEYVEEEDEAEYLHSEESKPEALLPTDLVQFFAEERLDVTRRSSKKITEFTLRGTLSLQIPLHLGVVAEVQIDAENTPGLYFLRVHKIHLGYFALKNTLLLGDLFAKSKETPDSGVCILDWEMENANISLLPLLVDYLPTPTTMYVHYEALPMVNLRNVLIKILIPNLSEKSIMTSLPGISWYDKNESTVNWSIPFIHNMSDERSYGALQIQGLPENPLPFPPISVDFTTENILSKLKVIKMEPEKPEDPNTYVMHSKLTTHKYHGEKHV